MQEHEHPRWPEFKLTRPIEEGQYYRVNAPLSLVNGKIVQVYKVEPFRDGGYFIVDGRGWFLVSKFFDPVTEEEIGNESEA